MNRDGFPGAVHAIGASTGRREHAGRVASSRTFEIADHIGGGAVPGSTGTVITSGARDSVDERPKAARTKGTQLLRIVTGDV